MISPAEREIVIPVLKRARALIEEPERWIQGAAARSRPWGTTVMPRSPLATCWCITGAVQNVTNGWAALYAIHVLDELALELNDRLDPDADDSPAAQWNDIDGRTHAEVLAFIDAAIKRAEGPAP